LIIILILVIVIAVIIFSWKCNHIKDSGNTISTEEKNVGDEKPFGIFKSGTNDAKGYYMVDIATKKLTPTNDPDTIDFTLFTGLPKKVETAEISTNFNKVYSQDKQQLIVLVYTIENIKDQNREPGSTSILKEEHFICMMDSKSCTKTDILTQARKANSRFSMVHMWDTQKSILLTHPSGPGIGDAGPVFMYNYKTQTLTTTEASNNKQVQELQRVPEGSFSPSAKKFIIIDAPTDNQFKIRLYNTNDISKPERIYAVSEFDWNTNNVDSVAWSPDEKTLAIGTDKKIYTLNFNTGEIVLRFTDESLNTSYSYWDKYRLEFSSSGRYILFVDHEGKEKGLDNDILKAIDLNSNQIIEIAHDENILL
jgi:WD40 repeat protein